MIKSTFLGQGTYGCTYKQKLKCINKSDKILKKQFKGDAMTKIHKDTSSALHEIEISKFILKIPNYSRYFSPILESCNANLAQIDKSDIDKCDFIPTTNKKKLTYFTTKSKYIVGQPMDDYFHTYTISQLSMQRIYDKLMYIYTYLLAGAQILNNANIVHCDIKASNIIIDHTDRPIYIDFGLSINIKDLLKTHSYNTIYFFNPLPDNSNIPIDGYEPWCIEIALMSYITEILDVQTSLTSPKLIFSESDRDILQSISNRYIDSLQLNNIIFSKKLVDNYKKKKCDNIANFVGQSYSDILKEVTEITYMNWDPYAITIMILKHIEYYIKDVNIIRKEHIDLMQSFLFK